MTRDTTVGVRMTRLKRSLQRLEEVKLTQVQASREQALVALSEAQRQRQVAASSPKLTMSGAQWQQWYHYVERLERQAQQQAVLVEEASMRVETQVVMVHEAYQDAERYASLSQQLARRVQLATAKQEQRNLDEHVVLQHGRGNQ